MEIDNSIFLVLIRCCTYTVHERPITIFRSVSTYMNLSFEGMAVYMKQNMPISLRLLQRSGGNSHGTTRLPLEVPIIRAFRLQVTINSIFSSGSECGREYLISSSLHRLKWLAYEFYVTIHTGTLCIINGEHFCGSGMIFFLILIWLCGSLGSSSGSSSRSSSGSGSKSNLWNKS